MIVNSIGLVFFRSALYWMYIRVFRSLDCVDVPFFIKLRFRCTKIMFLLFLCKYNALKIKYLFVMFGELSRRLVCNLFVTFL